MRLVGLLTTVAAALSLLEDGQSSALPPGSFPRPPESLPTFTRDVAPILFEHCGSCHRPGGGAPFSLLTYEDVRRRARLVATTTSSGFMPPWKPDSDSGPFVAERRLTEHERDVLSIWAELGTPEGNPADLPRAPVWPDGWRLGKPDLVAAMPEPFLLPAEGPDIFRSFVLRLDIEAMVYVKAFELQPGNTTAIHHANLLLDATPASRALDDADWSPGYEGLTAFTADYPDGHFLGWTPGQLAPPEPEAMAWPLAPGTDLVLQLHLKPTGRVERVQTTVGFFFSRSAPTITPTLLRLSRQGIDIPAGATVDLEDGYVLPVDVELHSIQPHAHYLARTIDAWADLPDGTRKPLIRIPDWDFNWQDSYRYVEPVKLLKGTRIAMRYSYDNSARNPRNPNQPPRRVRYGQRSTDEMAELYLQVVTRPSDRPTLLADYRPKEVREFIVGFETMLEDDPDNPSLHADLGSLYFEAGDATKAVDHFRETLRLRPGSALAHNHLGVVLEKLGRIDDALREYERALEILPDHPVSHFNVGSIREVRGEDREAVRHFRLALADTSLRPMLLVRLSWLLATSSEPSVREPTEALRMAEEAAAMSGRRDAIALDVLAAAHAALGQFDAAVSTAEAALTLAPNATFEAAVAARLKLYRAHQPFVSNPAVHR